MNIAVFADLHGRILLAFKLCARWQQETGQRIDLILQAGDLGAFPDLSRLDRATLRFAQRDPTELGFSSHFVTQSYETAAVLAQTTCPLIFVRGNHEDHPWLNALEQQQREPLFPVDVYQRIFCLKTAALYTYTTGHEHLRILGIGRIGQRSEEVKQAHIQRYEQERLQHLGDLAVDVLLTHDKPAETSSPGWGMTEITTTLDCYQPAYHFYGHTGGDCLMGTWNNGSTRFCKLADLEWHGPDKRVRPGSMAILHWTDQNTHSLHLVDQAWYSQYTAHTWLFL